MNAQISTAALLRPETVSQSTVGAGHARAALSSWLLGEHVQMHAGAQAGAVAGWLDLDGRASYVYPEITGYYLQWLAWQTACHGIDDDMRRRADAAQRWLLRWSFAADTPETRVYLEPATEDWRNSALFFFDLAMVLRGLASASRLCLIESNPKLVARISELLCQLLADDGLFNACSTSRTGRVLDRWSTRRGAFLSKAAAGVLQAAAQYPSLPPRLTRAAEATFAVALESMSREAHAESHPLLYSIEGALTLPKHPATAAATPHMTRQLRELLDRSTQMGHMPESQSGGGMRLDIVAQAIRAAALLLPANTSSMASVLVHYTDPKIGIPFSPDASPRQYSVWTAMFAEQALFASGCDPTDPVLFEFRRCLV